MDKKVNTISQKLKMLRAINNLTQAEVAKKLNISQQLYSNLEKKESISTDMVKKLCELYSVTADELLCLDANKTTTTIDLGNTQAPKDFGEQFECQCGGVYNLAISNRCPYCGRINYSKSSAMQNNAHEEFNPAQLYDLDYKYKNKTSEELYREAQFNVYERIAILHYLTYGRQYLDAMYDLGLYYFSIGKSDVAERIIGSAASLGHSKSNNFLMSMGAGQTQESKVNPVENVLKIFTAKGLGTGFIIDGGKVVTNYALIEGMETIKCEFSENCLIKGRFLLRVIKYDKDLDIAILKFADELLNLSFIKSPFKLDTQMAHINQRCIAFENVFDGDLSQKVGVVTSLDMSYNSCKGAISVKFDDFHSNSSGVLLSENFEVLGLLVFKYNSGSYLDALAIPSRYIISFIEN